MIRNPTVITGSTYLSMLTVGISIALVGAAARDIGLTPEQIGLLLAAQHGGFAVSVAIAGSLADVSPKPRIMVAGSGLLALGFAFLFVADALIVNMMLMALVGLGVGLYEGVTDALLIGLHQEKRARYISLNHFAVTVGALAIAVYLTVAGLHWRMSLVVSALLVVVVGIVFVFTRLPAGGGGGTGSSPLDLWHRIARLPRRGELAVLFVIVMLSVGMEICTLGELTTFLTEERGFGDTEAKLALLLFLTGIAGGRLGLGLLTNSRTAARQLMVLYALSAVTLTALFGFELGRGAYIVAFLAGAALSNQFPLALTLTGRSYPDSPGAALGLVKVALPVGGAVVPLSVAVLTGLTSFQTSLLIVPGVGLIGLALMSINTRLTDNQ